MSPHDPHVIYFGANRLFTSYDQGETWIGTKDLTKSLNRDTLSIMGVPGTQPMTAKNDGVGQWGTIIAIAESPVAPGVLWVGTDDGNLQVSRDAGATWTNVADNAAKFPVAFAAQSVEPSHFDAGTAYARSTAIIPATSSRISSRRPTTGARGRACRRICRRAATSTSSERTASTGTCCSSARSSGSSSRSTAGKPGRR